MSWTNKKYVEFRKSEVHGQMGAFARRSIPAETLVGVFTGDVYVVPIKDDGSLALDQFDFGFNDMIQICRWEDNVVCLVDRKIDPDEFDVSAIDHLNHSCRPNCVVRSSVQIWSIEDIAEDTELVFDYREIDVVPEGIECWCDTTEKCII